MNYTNAKMKIKIKTDNSEGNWDRNLTSFCIIFTEWDIPLYTELCKSKPWHYPSLLILILLVMKCCQFYFLNSSKLYQNISTINSILLGFSFLTFVPVIPSLSLYLFSFKFIFHIVMIVLLKWYSKTLSLCWYLSRGPSRGPSVVFVFLVRHLWPIVT